MEESHVLDKSCTLLLTRQQDLLVIPQMISTLSSVSFDSFSLIILDLMQGPDQHDSNCFDFRNLYRIRDIERVTNNEIDSPGLLEGIKVGILDEF